MNQLNTIMHKYRYIWQFSQIAYDKPLGDETLFDGKVSYVPMSRDLDFGYIVEFPQEVIIAFRGTGTRASDGVKSLLTWLSNLDLYPLRGEVNLVRRGRDRHEVLLNAGILSDGSWGKGTIHNGFYTTWVKFKDEVGATVARFKGKPIICTGHSRGGALAELCARHIAKNMGVPCTLIEYGTPCVGTADYVNQFQKLPVIATAIVNGYDLVVDLPPKRLGFDHAPSELCWLKRPWWHRLFRRIRDHFEECYTDGLEKYYRKEI